MKDFLTLGLSQPVLEAVQQLGFEIPTSIQSLVIPRLLNEQVDLVGLAQTGTGKTAAFGLPLVDLIDASNRDTQALILAPTRELVLQIQKEIELFASRTKGINIVAIYGGADIRGQIKQMQKGAQVVVATPGRLMDMMKRKKIDLTNIEILILDEADEMLNMGFRDDLDYILETVPQERRTWLFSATMSADIRKIAQNYMTDPIELTAGTRNASNEDIDHQYITLSPRHKYEALRRIMDYHPDFFGLIFCRTKRDTRDLAARMIADGYNAEALNGDLSQSQRDLVMERFRSGNLKAVVATDVAARGIDVNDITHVVHYNIPEDLAFYTHRSGRTGRAGNKGVSIVLMTNRDINRIRTIEKRAKIRFTHRSIPTGKEICDKHIANSLTELKTSKPSSGLETFLPKIHEELEELPKEELIERMAAYSFATVLDRYSDLQDLNAPSKGKKKFKGTKLFINIGRVDGLDKGSFLKLVCEHSGINGSSIGQIDLQHTYSYFQVEDDLTKQVMLKFRDTYIDGRKIRVNPADYKTKKKKKKKNKFNGKRKN